MQDKYHTIKRLEGSTSARRIFRIFVDVGVLERVDSHCTRRSLAQPNRRRTVDSPNPPTFVSVCASLNLTNCKRISRHRRN